MFNIKKMDNTTRQQLGAVQYTPYMFVGWFDKNQIEPKQEKGPQPMDLYTIDRCARPELYK